MVDGGRNETILKGFFLGKRHAELQMKATLAKEMLKEARARKAENQGVKEKVFEPKYDMEKLEDYGAKPPKSFWSEVEKKQWKEVRHRKGGIDYVKLERMAEDYPFPGILERVVRDLKEGARLGVAEEFRVASTANNAPSAMEAGYQVTDAVVGWLRDGYAMGPFEKEEVPFEDFKISGLMAKIKPNGKARVINNMSRGKPNSVNEGIDKEDFIYSMSSTRAWVRILIRCGKGARFMKVDWAEAYKQIPVHRDDVRLQGFAWLGKIFFELALVFGCVASVGIYDRADKVILFLALQKAEVPPHLAIQHLVDVCYAAPEKSEKSDRFYRAYLEVCEELNVRLADLTQKDKIFEPRTDGQVLGIDYDGLEMVWYLSEEKMGSIMELIEKLREDGEGTARKMKKLCGKLVDIRDLVEGAKYYLAHLIMAANVFSEKEDMEKMVQEEKWLERDLSFFSMVLPVYSSYRIRIREQWQDHQKLIQMRLGEAGQMLVGEWEFLWRTRFGLMSRGSWLCHAQAGGDLCGQRWQCEDVEQGMDHQVRHVH